MYEASRGETPAVISSPHIVQTELEALSRLNIEISRAGSVSLTSRTCLLCVTGEVKWCRQRQSALFSRLSGRGLGHFN